MKKILITIALTMLVMSAGFGVVGLSVKDFLSKIEILTTELPNKGYVRMQPGVWQTVILGKQDCYWGDFTRLSEAPRVGWKPAWNYIVEDLIPTVGNPPLTPEQEIICRTGLPVLEYVVQKNGTRTTRPLFDGALWLATRDTGAQWKQIGNIEIGKPCELQVIRKTTYEYRYCTNTAGVRGLTASIQKP